MRKKVIIYTDGACQGNPGPGGYGVILLYQNRRKEISAGYRLTTNNRMEILAAIAGLQALKTSCDVVLYTDSQYLKDAIMKGWARRWRLQGWKRNKKDRAKNPDLWETLLQLCEQHVVQFEWVPGHAGVPENERADELSVQAASQPHLLADEYYEKTVNSEPEIELEHQPRILKGF